MDLWSSCTRCAISWRGYPSAITTRSKPTRRPCWPTADSKPKRRPPLFRRHSRQAHYLYGATTGGRVVGSVVVLQCFGSSQRNSKCMTDEHIRVAWALQCENRGTECGTIPLNVLFCFNGLRF